MGTLGMRHNGSIIMPRKDSIGSTMIVLQERNNHQRRLQAIYSRPARPPTPQNPTQHTSYTLKQRYEDQQHLRTIQQLFHALNRGKTMADRTKDPHDFFAYPALFFRKVEEPKKRKEKKQKKQQIKRAKSTQLLSKQTSKISLQKIRPFLPLLSNFQQSDLQKLTYGINQMIISFDIVTPQELVNLAQKVIALLPKSCPQEFLEATALVFQQIARQMEEQA